MNVDLFVPSAAKMKSRFSLILESSEWDHEYGGGVDAAWRKESTHKHTSNNHISMKRAIIIDVNVNFTNFSEPIVFHYDTCSCNSTLAPIDYDHPQHGILFEVHVAVHIAGSDSHRGTIGI